MNIQEYSVALMTCFERNKTTAAIARVLDSSQSSASRFLKSISINAEDFKPYIYNMFGNKRLILVIDDSTLIRRYSQETDGTSIMIDQSTKSFTMGIKIVSAGLTDGKFFLPIDLEQWVAEFILKNDYLSKVELAKKIILRVLELGLEINYYALDGLYFAEDLIEFFQENNLDFVIKAKTTTTVVHKNKKMQVQDCPDLHLNSNQNQKKIKAKWRGRKLYFVAVRRTGKHGEKIIYLVSNFKAKSKVYARIYDARWCIESVPQNKEKCD